jgi:predicted metal-dependent phosphotriesterase family hydrolase
MVIGSFGSMSYSLKQEEVVRCVEGDLLPSTLGICDAHNHLWIEHLSGIPNGLPVLENYPAIQEELIDYRHKGGQSIVDCQPGGCGRNGKILRSLSQVSGIHVVACTGFHLAKYYPANYWLYSADIDHVLDYFISEITNGLKECQGVLKPIRAGFIKIACQDHIAEVPIALLKATVGAAIKTGVAVEVHTEKGSEAEKILAFFQSKGLESRRLIICHVDKRPDFGLHRELATAGAVLEYDTFYRSKYQPEKYLWKLIEQMVEAGLGNRLALATDMAEYTMWSHLGQGPGLVGFTDRIRPRLQAMGLSAATVAGLMGGNIARSLAFNP